MKEVRLRYRHIIAIAISFLVLCANSLAQEAKLSLSQLTERSAIVVVGKVVATRSAWNNERTRIYTYAEVAVREQLKGAQQQSSLTFRTLGGEVNGVGESYSHAAKFARDEDVVLFATRDRSGQYRVTAGEAGKFTIKEEAGTAMISETKSLQELKSAVRQAMKKESNK